MIKSFSGQVVFYFAIPRAISAYVGENWLSQFSNTGHCTFSGIDFLTCKMHFIL